MFSGYHAYASTGNRPAIPMHRMLLDAPKGFFVDHINGDGLDNRRENLRLCTRSENAQNQKTQHRPKTSKYKGVNKLKYGGWLVRIGLHENGKRVRKSIGCFPKDKEIEAAKAYDEAAVRYFGEFARLNFPEDWKDKVKNGFAVLVE
jgi:hypothetical protein